MAKDLGPERNRSMINQPFGRVYLIRNLVNQKVYVGQTTKSLLERWKSHASDSKFGSCAALYPAFKKYGSKSFLVEELCTSENREELDFLEVLFIAALSSQNPKYGYNIKDGGSHGKHVDSTKKKISEKNKGKIRTPEVRENLSRVQKVLRSGCSNKGKKRTLEQNLHNSNLRKGKSTKRWAHKVSATLKVMKIQPRDKGFICSPEIRKNISEGCKVKRNTPQYRLLLSYVNVLRQANRFGFYGS